MRAVILLSVVGVAVGGVPAHAQDVWLDISVQHDQHRFRSVAAGEEAPTRLDGSSLGWMAMGGGRLWTHLAVAIEWSQAGTIDDSRTLSLDVNGRPVQISSSFAHTTRSLSALTGYTHAVGARVQLSYLAGIAFTRVQRQFNSAAASVVLVTPSNVTTPTTVAVVDDFRSFAGGVTGHVRLTQHFHVATGIRTQRLHLSSDESGWSLRTFVGAGWVF